MNRREKHILLWLTLAVALCAGIGIWIVFAQSDEARTDSFKNRFIDLQTLGWSSPAGVSFAAESNSLSVQWAAGEDGFSIETQSMPIQETQSLQIDVYIGGTCNYEGNEYFGFRARFILTLFNQDEIVGQSTTELPLSSNKDRQRLYSMLANAQDTSANMFTLRLTVETIEETLAPGELTFAWLEVKQ